MTFRIHALPVEPFRLLFRMDEAELATIGAVRMTADAPNSAPCRVSLIDAAPGEALILLNHRHLDAPASPYRSNGPIFVREKAAAAMPASGDVPEMLARRLLSVRAYDAAAMMLDADVIEGQELAARLAVSLKDPAVEFVQIHTARRGCFMAEARRA